jgi:uncharacterized membrane protein
MGIAEHKGYDRLVNFTDAVVAIAATLLILPVVDAAAQLGSRDAEQFLARVVPELTMFAISFAIIANFWLEHHRLFRLIDKFDTFLIFFNFVWLFGIVLMPVPTALIVEGNADDAVAVTFYIGTMIVISLMHFVMCNHVRRHPEFEHGASRTANGWLSSLIVTIFFVIALIAGLVIPQFGLWGLLGMFLVPVTMKIIRRIAPVRHTAGASTARSKAPSKSGSTGR